MYLKPTTSGYSAGGQTAGRQFFLILIQEKDKPCSQENTRAIVRKVALRQCGHFMMGIARVKGERLTISGSYGSDGLPITVSANVFKEGIQLPAELYEAWSKGGGWNGIGSEGTAVRAWALANLKQLYKVE